MMEYCYSDTGSCLICDKYQKGACDLKTIKVNVYCFKDCILPPMMIPISIDLDGVCVCACMCVCACVCVRDKFYEFAL